MQKHHPPPGLSGLWGECCGTFFHMFRTSWFFLNRCGRGQGLRCTAGCMCLSVVDAMGSEGTEGLAFDARAWGPWDSTLTTLLTEPCCPSLLQLAPGVNSGQGLGIEIIGTLQLVLCVLATTDRRRRDLGGSGPLAIGFSVALGHLLAVSGGGSGGEWGGRGVGISQVGVLVGRVEPGC